MNRVHVKVPEIFLGVANSRRSLSRRIASLDRKCDRYGVPAVQSSLLVNRSSIGSALTLSPVPAFLHFILIFSC
jgi:hypothetical protein